MFCPSLQRLVEAKAGVSSVGPVMMMSVGAKVEQSAKPSYKMVRIYDIHAAWRFVNKGTSNHGLCTEKDNHECQISRFEKSEYYLSHVCFFIYLSEGLIK